MGVWYSFLFEAISFIRVHVPPFFLLYRIWHYIYMHRLFFLWLDSSSSLRMLCLQVKFMENRVHWMGLILQFVWRNNWNKKKQVMVIFSFLFFCCYSNDLEIWHSEIKKYYSWTRRAHKAFVRYTFLKNNVCFKIWRKRVFVWWKLQLISIICLATFFFLN